MIISYLFIIELISFRDISHIVTQINKIQLILNLIYFLFFFLLLFSFLLSIWTETLSLSVLPRLGKYIIVILSVDIRDR